jgi:hypothetical protein
MIGHSWPLFELVKDRTQDANAIVHGWLKPLVDQALREKRDNAQAGGRTKDDETFLSHLVNTTEGQYFCF